ncbi:MAG: helix-turn-helix domain-containing protein [Acidobacteriota bacterium]
MTPEESPTRRKSVAPRVGSLVQVIAGCKWSLTVFELLRRDINRPGAMVRSVEGLSTKALNECMRRLLEFELVGKTIFPEVPPRVEYAITAKGARLLEIFDAMDRLEADLEPTD